MTNNKILCFTCNKEKITYFCKGCSNEFCFTHLEQHRQKLGKELDEIVNDYNQFQQELICENNFKSRNILIEKINQWENESIEKIQKKAEECRQRVISYSNAFVNKIQENFDQLIGQIKIIYEENEFNELNLNYLKQRLMKIKKEFNDSSKIILHRKEQTFLDYISVKSSIKFKCNKWNQDGVTIAGGNGQGQQLNQLSNPEGIFIDENQIIFIADYMNNRIVEWKCDSNMGKIRATENRNGQLCEPANIVIDKQNHSLIIADMGNRRVIRWLNQNHQEILINDIDCCCLTMDKYGFLYVSDYKKDEVKRWNICEKMGVLVAGGNGQGNQLNQLNFPTYIFVDDEQSVYVSDRDNHRVMKWSKGAKVGVVVAGGNGQGNNLNQLASPEGLYVDEWKNIFVADNENDRIMRWYEGSKHGEVIVGGNGQGNQSNQFNSVTGLSFDFEGNLYIADWGNHRIQKFELIID